MSIRPPKPCRIERNVPYRYRNARRMEAADSLLRETTIPLRTIAEALGFVDEFHLSHAYNRARGIAPSVARRNDL